MAAIRQLVKARRTGLTVIPTTSIGMGADLLIGAGCVQTMHVSFVGLEFLGLAPQFRAAAEAGTIEIIEGDEAWIVFGLRAGAATLPFLPLPPLYEATDLPAANPRLRTTQDPYTGRTVTTIPALNPDVSVIHAQLADHWGNAVIKGMRRFENVMAKASGKVVITADRVVEALDVDPRLVSIPGPQVDWVVEAPFGAHPAASSGDYDVDVDHMVLYREWAADGRFEEYLQEYVDGPPDHVAYLERIGLSRLLELQYR
jgi:glutaconate CoA-transferase subunit A